MEPIEKFDDLFTKIRKRVERVYPLLSITYVWCAEADEEHIASFRQFSHVFHLNKHKICFARDIIYLVKKQIQGIIWHEVGHILMGPQASEDEANCKIKEDFSVTIVYGDDTIQRVVEDDE